MPNIGFVTEEPQMETEEVAGGERDRHQGLSLFLGVAFLLVSYALSVGPVMKLTCRKQTFPPLVVAVLYGPLDVLYNHLPVMKRFYDWYLYDVWKVGR